MDSISMPIDGHMEMMLIGWSTMPFDDTVEPELDESMKTFRGTWPLMAPPKKMYINDLML